MTDKQIIIDDVYVYKCVNAKRSIFGIDVECRLGGDCSQNPNCYYKQLKRAEQRIVELNKTIQAKEQECEELKKWLPIVTRLENEFENFEKAKAIDYKSYIEQIFIELDQLKSENKHLNDLLNQALKELEKTRETLTEIKEIVEKIDDSGGCAYGDYDCDNCSSLEEETVCTYKVKKLILQKISECEGNDE